MTFSVLPGPQLTCLLNGAHLSVEQSGSVCQACGVGNVEALTSSSQEKSAVEGSG